MVAPSAESVEKVTAWLSKNNITAQPTSAAGDLMKITVPVAQANTLLNADFNEYTWDETGKTSVRTLAYSIPESLSEHLAFVFPTTQ